jgi:hypothetical protein
VTDYWPAQLRNQNAIWEMLAQSIAGQKALLKVVF